MTPEDHVPTRAPPEVVDWLFEGLCSENRRPEPDEILIALCKRCRLAGCQNNLTCPRCGGARVLVGGTKMGNDVVINYHISLAVHTDQEVII